MFVRDKSCMMMVLANGEKYVSSDLFENKREVGTKNCNWVSQYI